MGEIEKDLLEYKGAISSQIIYETVSRLHPHYRKHKEFTVVVDNLRAFYQSKAVREGRSGSISFADVKKQEKMMEFVRNRAALDVDRLEFEIGFCENLLEL